MLNVDGNVGNVNLNDRDTTPHKAEESNETQSKFTSFI